MFAICLGFGIFIRYKFIAEVLSLNRVQVMLIVKIIYTSFMVWLICLFFIFLGSLRKSRKYDTLNMMV